ncbi:MAG: class I SAM-dependent methyltransferase [Xanthobacteraceae bacterium]|nr:MAG: class I SAM-dependent methyltransferase [Xanthobacteraceae bacterium]
MSLPAADRRTSRMPRPALIFTLYTAAIFTSALLLFSVQPLFTRMVLPRLGGLPAVWSVAMVFFQSLLLAGYAYAHYLMTLRSRLAPVVVHLVVLGAALATLPLAIAPGWGAPPAGEGAALWLIGLFVASIGLPFFALAANNPLLQAWFVRTGHPDGADPYFLYAASNVGSFLALMSYPFVLEPLLTLRAQNLAWSAGYGVLIVLIALCGALLAASPVAEHASNGVAPSPAPAPSWTARARWIFLAAVPSGLLVAVTAHISTDVAAAPLLWVLPLSLYLLTWVLVFQGRPLVSHQWVLRAQPLAIAAVVALLSAGSELPLLVMLGGHLAAFFVIAMACHGELARTRPAAAYLTGFYVALSFGGMIGGLFAGLIAPYTFSWIAEYPILLVLAALGRPAPEARARWQGGLWIAIAVAAAGLLAPLVTASAKLSIIDDHRVVVIALVAALAVLVMSDRWKVAAVIAVALALMRLYPADDGRVETVRSFFGVHKIVETADGRFNVLMHGTTIHGAQQIRNADGTPVTGRPEPITYYHTDGGIGRAIAAIRARAEAPLRVAVIGLGAGTLACQMKPGEHWRFFEIDRSIVELARDPRKFSYLARCAPDLEPVMGDARLTFAREPAGAYDLIIVDAYSSDAIPVHLATEEAMAIYKARLAPHGAVLMHVSNRHLELASVVVGIADANDLRSWVYDGGFSRDDEYIFTTEVVVSAREEADVGALATDENWTLTEPEEDQRVWTDDYCNIIGAVWRRLR